ncbi:MAG TPA: hypothetical protein VFM18_17505 [Methanosarcina sp.]|nr:hypothetical protein [Methanosarcina sp.]
MQIVWEPTVIEELKKHHTLLELETFNIKDLPNPVTAYCVVPAEKLMGDVANLGAYIKLHEGFIKALKDDDLELCKDISEHLMGRFGGELDSFYTEVLSRSE